MQGEAGNSATQLLEEELRAQKLLHEAGLLCARPGIPTARCLERLLDVAIEIARADKGDIQLTDADDVTLRIAAQRGFERPFLDFFASVQLDAATACAAAAQTKARTLVPDVATSELFAGAEARDALLEAGVRAVQSTPLVATDGTLLGMLSTHYTSPHRFDEAVLRRLDTLARQAADYLQRARADQALRDSEARYRAVVESQSEMVCRFRNDGTIVFVNEAYARVVRRTVAELEGSSFWKYVAAEDEPRVAALLDLLSPARREIRVENRFEGADGPRWTMWTNRALRFDAAGRWIEAQSTGVDITDHKRAEERLRASGDAFYRLVKNSPFGVYLIDADFRLAEVSLGAAATFAGVSPLIGRDFAEILRTIWPEPFATDAIGIFRRTLETGEPYTSDNFVEQRADRNVEEAYDWRTERVLMPDGRFGVVCYFYELTAQRRLEQQLRVANERSEAAIAALRESDRHKDEFLATLSHELRNPLAPMRYSLELLEQTNDSVTAAAARTTLKRQMAHMVRLMDDLLDVSRISRGTIALQRERVDLSSLVAEAVAGVRPMADSARLAIKLERPAEGVHVDGDPVRLAQIVGNLLHNAVRYSNPGGLIRCTVRRDGDEAVIGIEDRGVGIPPSKLDKIFDMFSQIERSIERSRGGLGIGLHLVKRLVGLHGGSVTAHSEGLGKGSEFVVRLPALAPAAAASTQDARGNGAAAADAGRGVPLKRVLVVDDNQDAALSLSTLLRFSGRETEVAHDGAEAVSKAASYQPDAILLDLGMPKMNGFDACRAIRRTAWPRRPVIVALSGYGSESDRNKSAEAGFDAHLVKPVDFTTLERLLVQLADTAGPRP